MTYQSITLNDQTILNDMKSNRRTIQAVCVHKVSSTSCSLQHDAK